MLVFVDESGDAGIKVTKGSSAIFSLAMVCFADDSAAHSATDAVERVASTLRHKSEFKFSKCRDEVRDAFFTELIKHDFEIRGLVADKRLIRSNSLKSNRDRLYMYYLEQLVRRHADALRNATMFIDGSGGQQFRLSLRGELRNLLPAGSIVDVKLRNSTSSRLLQLADMCVGAIYRGVRPDGIRNDRWLRQVQSKIVGQL